MRNITYRTTRNENTRCYFCKNNCLRTFIDVNTGDGEIAMPTAKQLIIETVDPGERPRNG